MQNEPIIEGRVFNLVAGLYRRLFTSHMLNRGLEVPNVLYSYVDTWFSYDFDYHGGSIACKDNH